MIFGKPDMPKPSDNARPLFCYPNEEDIATEMPLFDEREPV